jgi:putative ABC transport system substrate-binding protein
MAAALALEAGLPTVCEWREMAEQGCMMGYGPDITELRRRTADYVVRIFWGASPSELPIEGPTHFGFAINRKTANALALTIPPAILARADEVIELIRVRGHRARSGGGGDLLGRQRAE